MGRIVALHGLEGYLKVEVYTESDTLFAKGNTLEVEPRGGVPRPYEIERSRRQGRTLVLKLKGVEAGKHAERLVGAALFVRKESLPSLEEGEYYWFQLIGLKVVDRSGKEMGEIAHLFRTAAHDMLVVNTEEGELLIPLVARYVDRVDLEGGVVVLKVPGEELWNPR